jgi:S1-C subfamily serine protease
MSAEEGGSGSTSGPRSRGPLLIPLVIGLLGAVIGSGATLLVAGRGDSSSSNPVVRVAEGSSKGRPLTGVADVAKAVLPGVVRINVGGRTLPLGRMGTGSGVIFRSDGYIITNDHLVSRGDEIEVTLSNGEKLGARLVGTASPSDDIAVIKIDRGDLTPATLGSTKDLSVGDLAVAVGSPFGLEGTVTAGVVSALHRNVNLGRTRFTDAIQTDAPINPGNSGGALANSRGEVIGINTAIVGFGLAEGLGLAIPIEIAKGDAEQIIETGRAVRPFLGIAGESIPNDGGARVQEALPGGGAAQAGLTEGDVIIEVEGTKVGSMEDVVSVLMRFKVGDKVTVVHKRGDETRTVEVELRPPPEG